MSNSDYHIDPMTHFFQTRNLSDLDIIRKIVTEYYSATSQHPSFNSAHEGYAVIKDEINRIRREKYHQEIN